MPTIEHTTLGRSGSHVSRLCLGTATFGGQCDEATSFAILDHAYESGITFIDTADKYPLGSGFDEAGVTESIVGRWLASRKPNVVIATKVHGPTGPMPWQGGLGRRHLREAVDASLMRLGVDAIDLYQLHRPDPQTPIEETLETLNDFVRVGKVHQIGCSNFPAWKVAQGLGVSDRYGWSRFVSVQPRYNLLHRQIERELLPLCREESLGVIPYNLLAGGLLTGKHRGDSPPVESSRFATTGAAALYRERYWHDTAFAAVDELSAVALRLDVSLPTLATAWMLHQSDVSTLLLGATRPEQLDAPLAALDVTLDRDTLDELDSITRVFRQGDAEQ